MKAILQHMQSICETAVPKNISDVGDAVKTLVTPSNLRELVDRGDFKLPIETVQFLRNQMRALVDDAETANKAKVDNPENMMDRTDNESADRSPRHAAEVNELEPVPLLCDSSVIDNVRTDGMQISNATAELEIDKVTNQLNAVSSSAARDTSAKHLVRQILCLCMCSFNGIYLNVSTILTCRKC